MVIFSLSALFCYQLLPIWDPAAPYGTCAPIPISCPCCSVGGVVLSYTNLSFSQTLSEEMSITSQFEINTLKWGWGLGRD